MFKKIALTLQLLKLQSDGNVDAMLDFFLEHQHEVDERLFKKYIENYNSQEEYEDSPTDYQYSKAFYEKLWQNGDKIEYKLMKALCARVIHIIKNSNPAYSNQCVTNLIIPIMQCNLLELKESLLNFLLENPDYVTYLISMLQDPGIIDAQQCYDNFFLRALKLHNASLIVKLAAMPAPLDLKSFMQRNVLTDEQVTLIMSLSKLSHERATIYTNLMLEFTRGFGNITYAGGLLALTQLHYRKKYKFEPVLLNLGDDDDGGASDDKEIKKFFALLKIREPPFDEKFIVCAPHWIVGEIRANAKHEINIFLIDSLGSSDDMVHLVTQQVINIAHAAFPTAAIYISAQLRQNASRGCSVFSLDDLVHLHTIENFLPKKYIDSGIFGYLRDAVTMEMHISKTVKVKCSHLPLSFMRTYQSSALLKNEIPSRSEAEQESPVNKKNEIAMVSAQRFFQTNEAGKSLNKRIDYKLAQLIKYNSAFLLRLLNTDDRKGLEDHQSRFTLSGFEKRLKTSAAKRYQPK